ncbi:glycosyltransferase family A protein [Microbacterium sp.]|uniref:glycosyltransferase family 2 protein n=1 Tax=Microbacterium sp. TaxID=51671 RepID=UPI0027338DB9|nr:glycosyltransferase family A protein [Microbacterium sp.]MDP3952641.1 glycosyltransferase family A protein [Microbacterium sp.]
MPKVSVCCSVLNQSAWLEDMIGCVFAQSFQDWELIIVDDGSTEDIKAVIAKYNDEHHRVRYFRFDENRGIPHGINCAFQQAIGEYVQPLAADEILETDKLAIQVKYLDEHPEIAGVWGLPRNGKCGERPEWEQYQVKAQNRNRAQWIATFVNLDHVPLGGCSALWRRSVFEKIGYFDPTLTAFSDHEWYLRLIENYEIRVLPYRWALYREDPNSVSANLAGNKDEFDRQLAYVREKHPVPLEDLATKITVCIPVKDMAGYVTQAMQSVLGQTHIDLELIVVNDGSTDGTYDAVMTLIKETGDKRIHFHSFPNNRGDREACNYAIEHATGDYFAALSADDLIEPTYLARCVEIFQQNPHLEFIASQTDFIDAEGKPYEAEHPFKQIEKAANKTRDEWLARLWYGNVYFGCGTFRTKTLRDLGGWKQEYKQLSDYEMYLAVLQRGQIYVIEEALTHTRIHDTNQSIGIDSKWLADTYAAIKARYYQPRRKLIIATPFYESRGFSPYISAMTATVKMLGMVGMEHQFYEVSGDSYAHRAKNTILNRFLEDPEATDLLMIDSDMCWNAEAVFHMLSQPEEIIVGSYPQKNAWSMWTSIPKFEKAPDGRAFITEKKLPSGGSLMLGQDLAGGFMVIKRSALEKFKAAFPDLWYQDPSADPTAPDRVYWAFFWPEIREHRFWGEDRIFSRRLAEISMKWWIYTDINFSHWGVNGWSGNFKDHMATLKHADQTPAPIASVPQQEAA